MAIRGLDHLFLETHSFEQSANFWEGLGFKLEQKWGDQGHSAGLLRCDEAVIVLAEVSQSERPKQDIHFTMADPEKTMERLEQDLRVRITQPLHDSHWGTRLIQVQDPDGRVFWLESPKH